MVSFQVYSESSRFLRQKNGIFSYWGPETVSLWPTQAAHQASTVLTNERLLESYAHMDPAEKQELQEQLNNAVLDLSKLKLEHAELQEKHKQALAVHK